MRLNMETTCPHCGAPHTIGIPFDEENDNRLISVQCHPDSSLAREDESGGCGAAFVVQYEIKAVVTRRFVEAESS